MTQDTMSVPKQLTINNFVDMEKQTNAKTTKGKVQLAKSGELYISQPRSQSMTLITNLGAGFAALFGKRDWVLRVCNIENKNRQEAAIIKFAQLLDTKEMADFKLTKDGEEVPIGSPEFFKLYVDTGQGDTLVAKAVHKNQVEPIKLNREQIQNLTFLSVPGYSEKIDCRKLSPEEKLALAVIYNLLFDICVAEAPVLDENIGKLNTAQMSLLQALAADKKLLKQAQAQMYYARLIVQKMQFALENNDAHDLACAQVEFTCWNTFWEKKFGKEMADNVISNLLIQCSHEHALNHIIYESSDETSVRDFVFLNHSPSLSPVFNSANTTFYNAQKLYDPPKITEHEQTANTCCEQAGVGHVKEFLNMDSWDSFSNLCEKHYPNKANLSQEIERRHANMQPVAEYQADSAYQVGTTNFLQLVNECKDYL